MEMMAKAARGGKRSRTTAAAARRVPRRDVERERRQHMKALCDKLISLIPKEHFSNPDTVTQLGSLDEVASYIKKLKDRIEELHRRRSSAQAVATLRGASGVSTPITTISCGTGSLEGEKAWEVFAPMVEVRQHIDLSMDVVLICSIGKPVKFHDMITILEEEGAKIVNANHSIVGHKIFHTIHFQAFSSRIGINSTRISERLRAIA